MARFPTEDERERRRKRARDADDRRFKWWARGGQLAGLFVVVAWIIRDRLFLPAYTEACQVQMDAHHAGYYWVLALAFVLLYLTPMVGMGLAAKWRKWRWRL